MLDAETYKELAKPFPQEMLGTLNKGGTRLTYVPIAETINRLNTVLGLGNWSAQTLRCERDTLNPEWVIAHVRVTIQTGQGGVAIYEGHGGQQIKMMKDDKGPVDLGDEFKGAESDAFKKALQKIGIGLDLARKDDAKGYEARQEAQASFKPAEASLVQSIKDTVAELPEEQKTALRAWWGKEGLPGGYDKLSEDQVKAILDQLDVITAQPDLHPDEVPLTDEPALV